MQPFPGTIHTWFCRPADRYFYPFAGGRVVHVKEFSLTIHTGNDIVKAFYQYAIFLLALAQGVLGFFTLGNIAPINCDTPDLSIVVKDRIDAVFEPDVKPLILEDDRLPLVEDNVQLLFSGFGSLPAE